MDLEQQYDKLLKYCYAKTKNRELAEDIVQETFLRFWQVKSYRNMGKEMAYLITIARNLCLDAFKRKKTSRRRTRSLKPFRMKASTLNKPSSTVFW